jgi:ribosome recycling factor
MKEVLKDHESQMVSAVEAFRDELARLRTGRASLALVDGLTVEYYGTQTPLQQLASISVPEPQMLLVTPYDKSVIGDIERAIQASDLGLNPANDGNVIRLAFPPLNEERRRDLIRVVKNMAEEGRIAIRNVRRHSKDDIEALDGEVSEDDIRRGEARLQEVTDQHTARIDELLEHKEAELLEV